MAEAAKAYAAQHDETAAAAERSRHCKARNSEANVLREQRFLSAIEEALEISSGHGAWGLGDVRFPFAAERLALDGYDHIAKSRSALGVDGWEPNGLLWIRCGHHRAH